MRTRFVLVALLACSLPWQATALDPQFMPTKIEEAKPPVAPPLDGLLSLALNINFGDNRQVVGQFDGLYFRLGASLIGALDYHSGPHDWRNSLSINEGFAYGPPISKFVKSTDRLLLETTYYYHVPGADWFGPFAGARLDTPIFEGADYRANDVTYEFYDVFGNADPTRNRLARQLKTSGYFKPLTLKQVVGLYARPVAMEQVELQFRVGFGAQETWADNALAVRGDGTVPGTTIKVQDLYDFQQGGLEAGMTLQGALYEKRVGYKAYVEFMIPWLRSDKDKTDKTAIELTNVEVGATLAFKLVEWASLEYVLRVVRAPQLIDAWQIQNALMLTFAYTPIKRWEAPKAPPKPCCDCPAPQAPTPPEPPAEQKTP